MSGCLSMYVRLSLKLTRNPEKGLFYFIFLFWSYGLHLTTKKSKQLQHNSYQFNKFKMLKCSSKSY